MASFERVIQDLKKRFNGRQTPSFFSNQWTDTNLCSRKMVVQAKLEIGQINDVYEIEADQLASTIMQMSKTSSRIKELLKIKMSLINGLELSPDLEASLNLLKGGQPLPDSIRTFFESCYGFDFSQVRIYADEEATEMAQALNARAFTVGQDVVFGAGQYAPWTSAGKWLLAHELAHVIQQTRGNVSSDKKIRYLQCANGLISSLFADDPILQAVFKGQRLLRKGDKGQAVQIIQRALIIFGFPLPRFGDDGIYGNETASAVINYQRANGLTGDGIVGPITMRSMDAKMASVPRIVVKFKPDLITIPYQDAAQQVLPAFAALAWQQLASQFPGVVLSLNRLMRTNTADQITAILDAARERSGQEPPNLLSIMAIDIDGIVDRQAFVTAVKAWPFVEFAYEETPLVPASVDPSDDTFASQQGYLLPAPFGIDAFFAWNLPGSDGANVKFMDIERGWQLTHEDLAGAGVVVLNQSVPGNEWHSTACLGIVLAQDNDKGVIGIAPKVKGAIASSLSLTPTGYTLTLPDAFLLAVGFLEAGDVLLIEEHTRDGKPIEIDGHNALFIRVLTLLGIVVIEPAGNGVAGMGHNLDGVSLSNGTSLDRTKDNFFDSGAIIVGARQAAVRARISFSCFGNRVDCHAWGERIVTTSSVSGPFGPYMGVNSAGGGTGFGGTSGGTGFGGTSGASAIIAGAAVVLQGIARAKGTPLTPTRMRELLSGSFNTGTDNPDGIGVMPNLSEVVTRI